ncbi:hypothetical protein CCP3SC1AL1_1280005 [Gammaproteobacteria bacterium]
MVFHHLNNNIIKFINQNNYDKEQFLYFYLFLCFPYINIEKLFLKKNKKVNFFYTCIIYG